MMSEHLLDLNLFTLKLLIENLIFVEKCGVNYGSGKSIFKEIYFCLINLFFKLFFLLIQLSFIEHSLSARHMLVSESTKVTKNRVITLMELTVLTTAVAWSRSGHILQPPLTYKSEVFGLRQ